jgi:hypothetical protein
MSLYERNGGDLNAAKVPFVDFVGGQWWDVVKGAVSDKKKTKASLSAAAKMEKELKKMTTKSLGYLKAALTDIIAAPLKELLTLEFYSKYAPSILQCRLFCYCHHIVYSCVLVTWMLIV